MDSDGSDNEASWHGVLPIAPPPKRRKSSAQPTSSAFFYSSHQTEPSNLNRPTAVDEAELMRSMGLPTHLKGGTAEASNAPYSVWATDPSVQMTDSLTLNRGAGAQNPMLAGSFDRCLPCAGYKLTLEEFVAERAVQSTRMTGVTASALVLQQYQ